MYWDIRPRPKSRSTVPSLKMPELPYDVLLRVFEELVVLKQTVLLGYTGPWQCTSIARDLLACALVCPAWTLPAQRVLHKSIFLSSTDQAQHFARTIEARPDLTSATVILQLGWKMTANIPDQATALTFAVSLCTNTRVLVVEGLDEWCRPSLVAAIAGLEQIRELHWSGGWSDLEPGQWIISPAELNYLSLVNPSLRTVHLVSMPDLNWTRPGIVAPPTNITYLHLQNYRHQIDIQIIKCLGRSLQQLSVHYSWQFLDEPVKRDATDEAWGTLIPTLRHLSILNLKEPNWTGGSDWFHSLFPRLHSLEKLQVSDNYLPPRLFSALPPSLHTMERILVDARRGQVGELMRKVKESLAPSVGGLRRLTVCTGIFDPQPPSPSSLQEYLIAAGVQFSMTLSRSRPVDFFAGND